MTQDGLIVIDDMPPHRGISINRNRANHALRTCKLDSGKITHYDACGEMCNEYRKNFKLIGGGVVWEINNIPQNSTERTILCKEITPIHNPQNRSI